LIKATEDLRQTIYEKELYLKAELVKKAPDTAIALSLQKNISDLVSVTEIDGLQTSILELTVAKADIGKIIGKQGKTAAALRTLLGAVSAKVKKKAPCSKSWSDRERQ
jgi:hypothetical protein